MNPRDIAELRRHLNPDKMPGAVLHGLYVTESGEIITDFSRTIGAMNKEEAEKFLALFKKVLSGTAGQNLLNVEFSTDEVMNGEEHALLTQALTMSPEGVEGLKTRVLACIQEEGKNRPLSISEAQAAPNYLVLLLSSRMDVAARNSLDEEDPDQNTNVFTYLLCSVCPVKQSKPGLSYRSEDGDFRLRSSDWVAAAPEYGFLFPSYEEGGANLYRAQFYTRETGDPHPAFLMNVFGKTPSLTAPEQQAAIQAILTETLEEDCTLETVQAVHETISGMIEERKADKCAEPLSLTRQALRTVLEDCGVDQQRAAAFEEKCGETFGAHAEIPAVNVVSPRQFKVEAPGVSIQVSPECTSLLETRVIDGRRYILVPADGDVEVNGMKLRDGAGRE